ncbi:MAG TPA: EF2563 family selenium-dependent molybdenum hydroxylase system protein [Anaerolineaceae bacterium]|jgi:xanthine dehydrogenase accessory factor|nr:EF2563 family selenium-dependent molybdenum hydroxylase system protein [Anaerolineaceae bacterium]
MNMEKKRLILILGGGDLASGVAAVLRRNGWQVVISELPEPMVVRRKVAFAEAVWESQYAVEEIQSVLAGNDEEIESALLAGKIAVIVDPESRIAERFDFRAIVDARMMKRFQTNPFAEKFPLIGLGPGFIADENCLVVIETNRGDNLGKIIWKGSAEQDTGIPGIVEGIGLERVLYSHTEGIIRTFVEIGDLVRQGQMLAEVGGNEIVAPFDGTVRGMLRSGLRIKAHTKVGDVDPRKDPSLATHFSDKALIIGNSVLEVVENLL